MPKTVWLQRVGNECLHGLPLRVPACACHYDGAVSIPLPPGITQHPPGAFREERRVVGEKHGREILKSTNFTCNNFKERQKRCRSKILCRLFPRSVPHSDKEAEGVYSAAQGFEKYLFCANVSQPSRTSTFLLPSLPRVN